MYCVLSRLSIFAFFLESSSSIALTFYAEQKLLEILQKYYSSSIITHKMN